jgi:hypothetical protein
VKNEGSLRQRRAVIHAVLRYLVSNPEAKDTIEGIRKWWLPEGYREQPQDELEETLQFLVSKNWLTGRVVSEQKVYGLNKDCLKQIENYLNDLNDKE